MNEEKSFWSLKQEQLRANACADARESQEEGSLGAPTWQTGFPGGSDSKESACNAGDEGSIPGLGRSPGALNPPAILWALPPQCRPNFSRPSLPPS